jgi:polyketide synthase PksN
MTAIHMACVSLAHKECEVAIAGGISLLNPSLYRAVCRLNLAASHIDSRSFAERGDGFLPSESAGAVLLKPLSEAVKDNDNILAIIKSTVSGYVDSVANADRLGVASLPSTDAIATAIRENIIRSGLDPRTINCVESAANGLPVGDMVELSAICEAFRAFTEDEQFCALGSVESNMGHAVAASGISQLAKVILQLQHKQLAPHIKANGGSPDLRLEHTPFYLQQEAQEWHRVRLSLNGVDQAYPRRAMVHSMGYGGFYAGAIIEEYDGKGLGNSLSSVATAGQKQLIVLSAKTEERLRVAIQQLYLFVEKRNEIRLRDVAYTLQVGREAMAYRWAAIVDDRDNLLDVLRIASDQEGLDQSTNPGNVFKALVKPNAVVLDGLLDGEAQEQILQQYVRETNLAKLAAWWLKGADVPWDDLHEKGSSKRVWLPTYPFGVLDAAQSVIT